MMKKPRFTLFSAWLILGLCFALLMTNSCQHDGISADQMTPVPFSKVKVIFSSYCGSCHDGKDGEIRYNFNDSIDILNSVIPFNAAKSKSYQAITSTFEIMPPDKALPTNERTLIRLWIEQGAKPN